MSSDSSQTSLITKNRLRGMHVWGVLIFFLIFLTSSCQEDQSQIEPITLRFAFHQRDEEHFRALADQFEEEHPFIKIEPVFGNYQFVNNLEPSDADVFALSTNQMRRMMDQNSLLGLTPFIADDQIFHRGDFYPGTLELLNDGKETWGIPMGVDLYVMYYNQDLFDQAGLSYPTAGWDWDNFVDDAAAITQPDDPSNPVYGYGPTPDYQDTFALVYALGGSLVNDIQKPTRTTFDDPVTVDAIEFYAKLFLDWEVAPPPDVLQRYYSGNNNAFYEALRRGSIGMWVMPLSSQRFLRQFDQQNFDIGVAPLPAVLQSFSPIWVDEAYTISSDTSNLDESWEWISFLSYQVHPGRIPARISLIGTPEFNEYFGSETSDLARAVMQNARPFSLWYLEDLEQEFEYFSEAVEQIVTGESQPTEALERAQEQAMEEAP